MDELGHAVKRGIRENQLETENQDLISRLEARVQRVEGKAEDKYWYVSKSSSMKKVNEWMTILRREAMRGGAEEPTVVILGESGTGKEGIARMVHAGSSRGKGPWVAVNCANFTEQLLESELFGHERGAFTGAATMKRGLFEIAKGGTLFLDEIGEMDVKLQAKLLRVLQERVYRRVGGTADLTTDVRVIAATNLNLQSRVREGQFREDLYHRLSRVVVELPALRERTEDVIPMAIQFAERAFRSRGKSFSGFSGDAKDALAEYAWPGNVRELLNVVERAALVWEGSGNIGVDILSIAPTRSQSLPMQNGGPARLEAVPDNVASSAPGTPAQNFTNLKKVKAHSFERSFIEGLLQRSHGNVSAAAREAKINRSNLLRLMRRHGLKSHEYRRGDKQAA